MIGQTKLDHLVIGAATLEQGVSYVRDKLGVDIPKGGEHPLMGTHNHVMKLGDDFFLEVIAFNPHAAAPTRPRWYGLDDPDVRRSLEVGPRLLTWAANTDNLVQLMAKTDFQLGESTLVTRGELSWLFAVPDDGRLLASGMLPSLLQWHTEHHPANNMVDLKVRCKSLTVHHPYADWLSSILKVIDATNLVQVVALKANELPYLRAEFDTPNGVVELDSRGSM